MAALASVPPKILCEMLRRAGYSLIKESPYNWIYYKDGITDFPLLNVPKRGKLVALQVLETLLFNAGIDDAKYLVWKSELAGPASQ